MDSLESLGEEKKKRILLGAENVKALISKRLI